MYVCIHRATVLSCLLQHIRVNCDSFGSAPPHSLEIHPQPVLSSSLTLFLFISPEKSGGGRELRLCLSLSN